MTRPQARAQSTQPTPTMHCAPHHRLFHPRWPVWLQRLCVGIVLATALAGGVRAQATESALPETPAYRVGAGDELNFRFPYTPELNTAAVVRGDGAVSLPMLGEFKVVGYTLAELSERVQTALATRVRRPQVVINVQGSMPSQRIFVGGEVARPGVQNLAGPLTALQAVMAAEGLKDTAQPSRITVLRQGPGGQRMTIKLDLAAVMEGREGAQDIALAPYDVVLVPRSGIANMGLWVDQWVRRILPISLGFSYTINRNGTLQ